MQNLYRHKPALHQLASIRRQEPTEPNKTWVNVLASSDKHSGPYASRRLTSTSAGVLFHVGFRTLGRMAGTWATVEKHAS